MGDCERFSDMYEVQKAKYVYTWEVFGDLRAHNDDCFRMFNPVTEAVAPPAPQTVHAPRTQGASAAVRR